MNIASSNITLSSAHSFVQGDEVTEELQFWNRPSGQQRTAPAEPPRWGRGGRDRVSLSREALAASAGRSSPACTGQGHCKGQRKDDLAARDNRAYLAKLLIEAITGRKVDLQVLDPADLACDPEDPRAAAEPPPATDSEPAGEGWGLTYDRHELHYEAEVSSFTAEGVIKTSDGKEISFSVQLQMTRAFLSKEEVSLRAGDAARVDPLVINFDGAAAELTSTKFAFDLNADGTPENISVLQPGSGFLALDLNNDGKINDGRELFGPGSGNGFAELAAYDEDGNRWIDANDSIYNRLSVWTKDGEGNDHLTSLSDQDVGAIYLGQVPSPFQLTDPGNTLLGLVSTTGIYVQEDGTVNTIQQLDMVV
jgi:hypothetical protein